MRTLGASYSRTLRTDDAQRVVDDGPYRLIRHPGYAGSLLVWSGFALTSGSPARRRGGHRPARPRLPAAHRGREVLLRRDLPGYGGYCRRTKRLVPFIW